jgi:hypothetical protein
MNRSWTEMLVSVAVALIILTVAVRWLFGASPYVQFMKHLHNDIPRQVIPVELVQGTPVTFQTRIIQSMTYDLNLLVYFDDREQRARADDLIGTSAARPGKLLTVVRIAVRDEENRTIYDQTVRSEGVIKTSNYFIGRKLDRLALNERIYEVSVTPLSDVSGIAPFRTALEVYYLTK